LQKKKPSSVSLTWKALRNEKKSEKESPDGVPKGANALPGVKLPKEDDAFAKKKKRGGGEKGSEAEGGGGG